MTERKPAKRPSKRISDLTQDEIFRARLLSPDASEKLTTDIHDADFQRLPQKFKKEPTDGQ